MALIDFVICTYDRFEPLLGIITSLKVQTDKDWEANIIIDDQWFSENGQKWNKLLEEQSILDRRIKYTFLDKRYNDWGHTPREKGKQLSISDYVLMTNDDNYYTPNFVAELRKAAENKPGMIYWDMVHSHYDYQYFKCFPAYNQIDMGAFATRRDLAQQIKLNTSYAADGEYVRDFNERFPNEQKIKINKCLFIHN